MGFGSEKQMVDNHVKLCRHLKINSPLIFDVLANHGLISFDYCSS